MSQLKTSRVTQLPDDIDALLQPATSEGFRFLNRLVQDYSAGINCFDQPGEALYVIRRNEDLIAIGGINVESSISDRRLGRIRRLYVHPDERRGGIGRLLMTEIEKHATECFDTLQLFTDTTDASNFYCRLGYQLVTGDTVSHVKHLR
ncbi:MULTISPECIES: GNAT family N-acetyltransferase [Oxalobacteraceae]|uniref:GNAT family N-acetyltransferase n=1 Tax=Herminiimonas sp. Marseille-P9896 TaxID=2742211 RepID=UPI00158F067A|nr:MULTISPECIES: GNAT family N-acetyltransferase [Oxalobacteraceae]